MSPSPLDVLAYLSPCATLFFASLTVLYTPSSGPPDLPEIVQIVVQKVVPRRGLSNGLLTAILLTYFGEGAAFVATVLITKLWPEDGRGSAEVVYTLGNIIVWGLFGAWIIGRDRFLHPGTASTVGATFVIECVVLGYRAKWLAQGTDPSDSTFHIFAITEVVFSSLRVLHLPVLFWALSSPAVSFQTTTSTERDPLLAEDGDRAPSNQTSADVSRPLTATQGESMPGSSSYGTFNGQGSSKPDANGKTSKKGGDKDKSSDKTGLPPPSEMSWSAWFARFAKLIPHLWPSGSGKLQSAAIACVGLLVLGRIVNVAVPTVLGMVVASLTGWERPVDGGRRSPWPYIALYVGLRFCQGSGGILSVGQSLLWAPVAQYADREMTCMTFDHLLELSLAYHTRRKTGEVLRVLDRGSSINSIFQTMLMSLLPVIFDIAFAILFFFAFYGWKLSSLIAGIMGAYIAVSIALTTWRTKLRRQMNERDVLARGIHTDILMNWESVKYFTAEDRESRRYREAILSFQEVEYKVIWSLSALNFVQQTIITFGLLGGSLLIAYDVTQGRADAGQFVVFLVYLGQLAGPLNMLGMLYRQLNAYVVDAEKLLKLLAEETEVVDQPGAKDLIIQDGVIEFKNVRFGYSPELEALKGISFTIGKGESVALVGESGSGKSSLLRLLYRFYDIWDGSISIDGQNIKNVTQKSLRRAIGIVPQEPVLFNDTIAMNIGYGKEGSSMEEIEAAAKAARLHDRIMEFPEQYNTVVGERGIRLSGGEKQRVSLARTILKAPAILVLDEATSALDTENERVVQQSLNDLAKGRSSLMIAHRLSTIVNADKIIVLKSGKIIEMGSHKDLLAKEDGVFASMWKAQITAEVDGEIVAEDSATGVHSEIPSVIVPSDAFGPKGSDGSESGRVDHPKASEGLENGYVLPDGHPSDQNRGTTSGSHASHATSTQNGHVSSGVSQLDEEPPALVETTSTDSPAGKPLEVDAGVQRKIPITLLTGFLGSGKTTLLQHIMTANHGYKVAVCMNDFGDTTDIESTAMTFSEPSGSSDPSQSTAFLSLPNGCLCCSIKEPGIMAIENMVTQQPAGEKSVDWVVVELTGLADPAQIARSFWIDEEMGGKLRLDGVVCVVDAKNLQKQLSEGHDLIDLCQRQIAASDVLLLNKEDLVDAAAIEKCEASIRSINPTAIIKRTTKSLVDLGELFPLNSYSSSNDQGPEEGSSLAWTKTVEVSSDAPGHGHADVTNVRMSVPSLNAAQRQRLEEFLQKAHWDNERPGSDSGEEIIVLRSKGIFCHQDRSLEVLQGVWDVFDVRKLAPATGDDVTGKLVLIGRNLGKEEDWQESLDKWLCE